jgi:hypothetical protein
MGDGRLLEEAVFRNCQFSQVGRAETVSPAKLAEAINSMLPAPPRQIPSAGAGRTPQPPLRVDN